MSSNDDSEFIRRKFTLTETLDEELEEMATDHYQGNVSMCLRQAITDHRETLNGDGRLALKRLSQSLRQVQENVSDINHSIDAITEHIERDVVRATPKTRQNKIPYQGTESSYHILEILSDADGAMRAADIIEQAKLKPMVVRQTLGHLIDQGHIMPTSERPPRYYLARMTTSPDQSRELE